MHLQFHVEIKIDIYHRSHIYGTHGGTGDVKGLLHTFLFRPQKLIPIHLIHQ